MGPALFVITGLFLFTAVNGQRRQFFDLPTVKDTNARVIASSKAYILSERNNVTYGWSDESTSLAVLGLVSENPQWSNMIRNPEDDLLRTVDYFETELTKKQFVNELLLELKKNSRLTHIRTSLLARMVSAIRAVCMDPSDFFGHDFVSLLEDRITGLQKSSPMYPGLVLTLCVNGRRLVRSVPRLGNDFAHGDDCAFCTETAALRMLALTCLYDGRREGAKETFFLSRIHANGDYLSTVQKPSGSFGSLQATSLVLQALTESPINIDVDGFAAWKYIVQRRRSDGGFGAVDITATVIPALSRRTPLALPKLDCFKREGGRPLEDGQYLFKYQIFDKIKTGEEFRGSFITRSGMTLTQAMEDYSKKNPDIVKIELDRSPLGTYISSINKIGGGGQFTFWKVYTVDIVTGKKSQLTDDLDDVILDAKKPTIFRFEFTSN